jgi:hypothetical protein
MIAPTVAIALSIPGSALLVAASTSAWKSRVVRADQGWLGRGLIRSAAMSEPPSAAAAPAKAGCHPAGSCLLVRAAELGEGDAKRTSVPRSRVKKRR